jgi:hypothetical protein
MANGSDNAEIYKRLGHIENQLTSICERLPDDLPVRLDRLEQSEASRRWHIRSMWAAVLSALAAWAHSFFAPHK